MGFEGYAWRAEGTMMELQKHIVDRVPRGCAIIFLAKILSGTCFCQ